MKTKRLPDKLHELLALALKDLRKAERSKKYKIDMSEWHSPNSHCSVCMAGAVIAFDLGGDPSEFLPPSRFDDDTSNKLRAIDNLRGGLVSVAMAIIDPSDPMEESQKVVKARELNRPTPFYPLRANATRQREKFYDAMKQLQKDLKQANL